MKLHPSLSALCAALVLSACGGGGGDTPPPPTPTAKKLNVDNMLNATAAAQLADERVSGEFAALLSLVLPRYIGQVAPGSYPCSKSGSLTVSRSGTNNSLWTFTANKCATDKLSIGSGAVEIDTAGADTAGLGFTIRDVIYTQADMSTPVATLNGKYQFLVPSNADVSRSSTGALTLVQSGVSHVYTEHYTEGKKSDGNYLKQGVKLQSPKFPHSLSVAYDKASNSYTLSADDGSTVVATFNASGGAKLELRATASGTALTTSEVAKLDIDMARVKMF